MAQGPLSQVSSYPAFLKRRRVFCLSRRQRIAIVMEARRAVARFARSARGICRVSGGSEGGPRWFGVAATRQAERSSASLAAARRHSSA
jgi:hypothetical protein